MRFEIGWPDDLVKVAWGVCPCVAVCNASAHVPVLIIRDGDQLHGQGSWSLLQKLTFEEVAPAFSPCLEQLLRHSQEDPDVQLGRDCLTH